MNLMNDTIRARMRWEKHFAMFSILYFIFLNFLIII